MAVSMPKISDAEWEVMRTIWEHGPMTAEEVIASLDTKRDWSHRTVRTLLGRLERKGALAHSSSGRRYVYRAAVARDACLKRESRSFLSRVFNGAIAPAIVHLVESADLSPREIEELKAILDRKGGRRER
jgi:BlaI family transcriptional regulator, penicillinase repressor